jgi:hypothetical protein
VSHPFFEPRVPYVNGPAIQAGPTGVYQPDLAQMTRPTRSLVPMTPIAPPSGAVNGNPVADFEPEVTYVAGDPIQVTTTEITSGGSNLPQTKALDGNSGQELFSKIPGGVMGSNDPGFPPSQFEPEIHIPTATAPDPFDQQHWISPYRGIVSGEQEPGVVDGSFGKITGSVAAVMGTPLGYNPDQFEPESNYLPGPAIQAQSKIVSTATGQVVNDAFAKIVDTAPMGDVGTGPQPATVPNQGDALGRDVPNPSTNP